jgi:hypothetical protein
MTYERSQCNATSQATATFTLTNRPPANLPPYVTLRADDPSSRTNPGDNLLLVTYYGTASARILDVQVDGHPVTVATGREKGLIAATLQLEMPAGASRTITIRLLEPASTTAVQVLRQPLVRPLEVELRGPTC